MRWTMPQGWPVLEGRPSQPQSSPSTRSASHPAPRPRILDRRTIAAARAHLAGGDARRARALAESLPNGPSARAPRTTCPPQRRRVERTPRACRRASARGSRGRGRAPRVRGRDPRVARRLPRTSPRASSRPRATPTPRSSSRSDSTTHAPSGNARGDGTRSLQGRRPGRRGAPRPSRGARRPHSGAPTTTRGAPLNGAHGGLVVRVRPRADAPRDPR